MSKQNHNSFKQHNQKVDAYWIGAEDKRLGRPYKNPFDKNMKKAYHKAYKNGYNNR